MKRSRLMGLSLVVAIMLMGTAYAAWTQTINVSSTVKTGSLEVAVTDAHANGRIDYYIDGDIQLSDELANNAMAWAPHKELIKRNEKIKADGVAEPGVIKETGEVKFKVKNSFPGSQNSYLVEYTNSGTVPADIDFEVKEDGLQNLDGVDYWVRVKMGSDSEDYFGEELQAAFDDAETLNLEPNESVQVVIFQTLTDDLDETQLEEEAKYNLEVIASVSQYNMD